VADFEFMKRDVIARNAVTGQSLYLPLLRVVTYLPSAGSLRGDSVEAGQAPAPLPLGGGKGEIF